MTTLVLGRRRTSRTGLAAVLAAVLAGLVVYSYLSWLRSQVPVAGHLVPMVVAAADIEPGVRIQPGMVTVVNHPSRYLPEGALSSTDDAVGRLSTIPILSGEPVVGRKVARNHGASGAVPEGYRAYGLSPQALSESTLAPRSGDVVDVLATASNFDGDAQTVTIMRSVTVAAAGDEDGAAGFGLSNSGGIALLVTPDQAEVLAQAESVGRITLVLVPTGPAHQ